MMTVTKAAATGPGIAMNTAADLGEERYGGDGHPDYDAHLPRRYSRNLGQGHAGRVGRVGQRSGQAREQVAYTIGIKGALHHTEVGSLLTSPRNLLDRYAIPDGFYRADKSDHHEGRQQRPELRPRRDVKPWPRTHRNAHPKRRPEHTERRTARKTLRPRSLPRCQ